MPGKGSFVTDNADMGEKRRKELRDRLCGLVAELKFLGASEAELVELVKSVPERDGSASDGGAAVPTTAGGVIGSAAVAESGNASEDNNREGTL